MSFTWFLNLWLLLEIEVLRKIILNIIIFQELRNLFHLRKRSNLRRKLRFYNMPMSIFIPHRALIGLRIQYLGSFADNILYFRYIINTILYLSNILRYISLYIQVTSLIIHNETTILSLNLYSSPHIFVSEINFRYDTFLKKNVARI